MDNWVLKISIWQGWILQDKEASTALPPWFLDDVKKKQRERETESRRIKYNRRARRRNRRLVGERESKRQVEEHGGWLKRVGV